MADRARLPARADHRDRARREQPRDRRRLGLASRAPRPRRSTLVVGAIVEPHPHRAVGRSGCSASQPASAKTLSIFELPGSVSATNVRDAVRARDAGEVLEQQRRQPAPLLVVGDRERDLGLVGRDAVVARDRDDVVAELGDEHHVVDVVDRRDAARAAPRSGAEPARRTADRSTRRSAARRARARRFVVGPAGPDPCRPAVGEHDVALPPGRILEPPPHVRSTGQLAIPSRTVVVGSVGSFGTACDTGAATASPPSVAGRRNGRALDRRDRTDPRGRAGFAPRGHRAHGRACRR